MKYLSAVSLCLLSLMLSLQPTQSSAYRLPASLVAEHSALFVPGHINRTAATDAGFSGPKVRGGNAQEVVGLRSRSSRTYLASDGTYQEQAFAVPINYQDSKGTWQPIDDTLVPFGHGESGYRNKADGYGLTLPGQIEAQPVRIDLEGHFLSFQLEGAKGPGSVVGSAGEFSNALRSTTVRYTALSTGVKEELELANASAPSRFLFNITYSPSLHAAASDGGIAFSDSSGKLVFTLPAPFMTDAGGLSKSVLVGLVVSRPGEATLTLKPDRSWLGASSRQWPVTIDPTVTITYNGSSVVKTYSGANQDCYIQNGSNANTSLCGARTILTGYDGNVINRSLLQFNISIQSDATVLKADLALYASSTQNSTSLPIEVHQVTQSWTTGATWNSANGSTAWTTAGGTFSASASATNSAVGPGAGWYHWYLSKLVQGWVDGSIPNQGMILKGSNEGTVDAITFRSSEYSQSTYWPYLQITYQLAIGQQSWYQFQTRQLTDRMSGNVQIANGNWFLPYHLTSIRGTGLNESLDLDYNNLAPQVWDFGRSWLLETGWDVWLRTNDGDGISLYGPSGWAAHFLANGDGTYQDAPGIDASLTHNGDGTYTVQFPGSGEKYNFSTTGTELTSDVDRHGNKISFAYDANGALSTITDTQGRVTTFSYVSGGGPTCGPPTASGFVGSITDPANRKWSFTYDTNCNLTSIKDPAHGTTTFAYDANTDQTQITDPLGHETKVTYDSSFRVTSVTYVTNLAAGTGETTNFTYNSGNTVVTDPKNNQTTHYPDAKDREVKLTDASGHTSTSTFTSDDHVASHQDPAGTTVQLGTDSHNNVTATTVSQGSSQIASSAGFADPANPNSPTSSTDTQGNTSTLVYDSSGDVTKYTDPLNNVTQYTYNPDGTLSSMTDPRNYVTTWQYDTHGNVTQIAYPSPRGSVDFTYDGLGRTLTRTDGKGQKTTYSYDVLDHVTQVLYSDSRSVSYGYDADGNRTSMVDGTGTTTWTFDLLNRLTGVSLPGSQSISYSYDNSDNVISRTDVSGTEQRTYNADNQISSITPPGGSSIGLSYDSDGRLYQIAYPNGVTETYTYSNLGAPATISSSKDGGPNLTSFSYSFTSTTGAPTSNVDSFTDVNNNTTSYQYDADGRLTQATQKNQGGTTLAAYAYGYDGNGNLTSQTINGTASSLTYDAANDLTAVGTTTYSSDANSNITGNSSGLSLTYNTGNQTSSITPAGGSAQSMTYMGTGQTLRTGAGSTTFQNDLGGVSEVSDSQGTRYLTRLPSGLVVAEKTAAGIYYYLHDQLGSTVALTDSSGNVVNSYQYDPYGNVVSQTEGVANSVKWQGAIWDATTQLYKMGSRYYSPSLGRFTQLDPAVQSADGFVFAQDNPVNFTDPSGNWCCLNWWINWAWWGFWGSVWFHLSGYDVYVIQWWWPGLATLIGTIVGAIIGDLPGAIIGAFLGFAMSTILLWPIENANWWSGGRGAWVIVDFWWHWTGWYYAHYYTEPGGAGYWWGGWIW